MNRPFLPMENLLGNYTLAESLGSSPLVDTYRGTDGSLGRTVSVKVLRPDVAARPELRAAILEYARQCVPLSHPNIAELYEVGEQGGKYYLVYEHSEGETLRATVAGTPLNLRRALDIAIQLADALAEAHGRGIVHGTLRPESILITGKGRPKILDFGLGLAYAAMRPASDVSAFQKLSPDDVECMAPEQVLGAQADERADLFALGCVLFEMLTGTQPFSAATAPDTAVAVLGRTAPPPSQMNARIPDALDRIVAMCLIKSLDKRASSAAAVAAKLREVATAIEDKSAVAAPALMPRSERRSPLLVILVILLVLAAAGAVAFLLFIR